MGLKEKLKALSNSQVYQLWDLWIRQNAELPNESDMINELLSATMCDSDSKTELLADVDNIDNICCRPAEYYVSECPDTGREFLVQTGKDGNIAELTSDNVHAMGLLNFLQEQYKHYQSEVLPLMPDFGVIGVEDAEDDYMMFDGLKNEFLESLWDVISQHFDDADHTKVFKK